MGSSSYADDLRRAQADPLAFERETTGILLTQLRKVERERDQLREALERIANLKPPTYESELARAALELRT